MIDPFSLKDKLILITGASSGIGRQCAISCSEMGAKLVLVARNEKKLKEVLSELYGEGHIYFSQDITDYSEIKKIVEKTVEKLGKLDGFIHSAGIEITKPLKVMKPEDYEMIYSVNVISGFEFAKHVSKKKNSNDLASFIYISSVMSVTGNSGLTAYCSSKGALVAGVRALAIEYANRKIRFNCISPGYIKTEMMDNIKQKLSGSEINKLQGYFPLGLGDPRDIANSCIYLLSGASKWVTGTNLIVDGGYSAK